MSFSPQDLSGLVYWFDPALLSASLVDGAPVTGTFPLAVGGTATAQAQTAGRTLTYQSVSAQTGGPAVVSSPGDNTWAGLVSDLAITIPPSGCTFYMVYRDDTLGDSIIGRYGVFTALPDTGTWLSINRIHQINTGWQGTSNNVTLYYKDTSGTVRVADSRIALSPGGARALAVTRQGSQHNFLGLGYPTYSNIAYGSAGYNATLQRVWAGAAAGVTLGDVLIYDRTHTLEEMQQVLAFLAEKHPGTRQIPAPVPPEVSPGLILESVDHGGMRLQLEQDLAPGRLLALEWQLSLDPEFTELLPVAATYPPGPYYQILYSTTATAPPFTPDWPPGALRTYVRARFHTVAGPYPWASVTAEVPPLDLLGTFRVPDAPEIASPWVESYRYWSLGEEDAPFGMSQAEGGLTLHAPEFTGDWYHAYMELGLKSQSAYQFSGSSFSFEIPRETLLHSRMCRDYSDIEVVIRGPAASLWIGAYPDADGFYGDVSGNNIYEYWEDENAFPTFWRVTVDPDGTRLTVETSTDGVAWTQVGEDEANWRGPFFVRFYFYLVDRTIEEGEVQEAFSVPLIRHINTLDGPRSYYTSEPVLFEPCCEDLRYDLGVRPQGGTDVTTLAEGVPGFIYIHTGVLAPGTYDVFLRPSGTVSWELVSSVVVKECAPDQLVPLSHWEDPEWKQVGIAHLLAL